MQIRENQLGITDDTISIRSNNTEPFHQERLLIAKTPASDEGEFQECTTPKGVKLQFTGRKPIWQIAIC